MIRRQSFFWKLYLSYGALVVASAIVIGILVNGNLHKNALRDMRQSLHGTARMLASLEAAHPANLWSDQLPRQVAEAALETGLHLTMILADGTRVAESLEKDHSKNPEEILEMPEFVEARKASFGQAIRSLSPDGPQFLLVAAPILFEYETIGYVRVGLPLARLAARQGELGRRVLAGTSVNALVALVLGFFFARHVTRPLERIGEVCRRIAAGKTTERIGLMRRDEIGVVASTIDHMAAELQRRVNEADRERNRLAALLGVMADGVVAVSARQTIAYLNDVAARLLSLSLSNAAGRPFFEEVQLGAVVAVYEEAVSSGHRVFKEVRVTGHPHDLVLGVYATPLRDPVDRPFGVLLVMHDLTEIRRLEEVRRIFAANVSHELKTPLTAIGSLVDTLIDDPDMQPGTRSRFLGKIADQNQRLYQLVQHMLIISRLESEDRVLETAPLQLSPVVEQCCQTFTDIALSRGICLGFEDREPETPLVIQGNEEAVRLIVNNLLHNAVQHTPAEGQVTVSLRRAAGHAVVETRDTGAGIAAEHLERIFERFYRVDRARTRDAGGSGLGLSIVKHLTHALGGHVLVESKIGEGSVFTVHLPLAN